MPGGNGTGPLGEGPGTGRRAGFCGGAIRPGNLNPGSGFGFGGRRGRGGKGFCGVNPASSGWRGFGGWVRSAQTLEPQTERHILRSQAEALKTQLDLITRRLEELEPDPGTE